MNYAIKDFLKTRLHLETSEEKSKVINLKKNSSEFLGFSFRAKRKGKTRMGYVAQSNMTKKAKSNAFIKIKESIKAIQKKPCTRNSLALQYSCNGNSKLLRSSHSNHK